MPLSVNGCLWADSQSRVHVHCANDSVNGSDDVNGLSLARSLLLIWALPSSVWWLPSLGNKDTRPGRPDWFSADDRPLPGFPAARGTWPCFNLQKICFLRNFRGEEIQIVLWHSLPGGLFWAHDVAHSWINRENQIRRFVPRDHSTYGKVHIPSVTVPLCYDLVKGW